MFTFSTKREIRHIHVAVEQRRQKNIQKSVRRVPGACQARAELSFCQSKSIPFLPFSLTSPLSLLKLPTDQLQKSLFTILNQLKIEYPYQRDRPCTKSLVKPGLTSYQVFKNVPNRENQALTTAQLFKGRLGLNLGLNLTRVSFSCVQKHFL